MTFDAEKLARERIPTPAGNASIEGIALARAAYAAGLRRAAEIARERATGKVLHMDIPDRSKVTHEQTATEALRATLGSLADDIEQELSNDKAG